MNLKERNRHLFRSFSNLKGFDGWLIGKVEMIEEAEMIKEAEVIEKSEMIKEAEETAGSDGETKDPAGDKRSDEPAVVKKLKKNYAVLEARLGKIKMWMHILNPGTKMDAVGGTDKNKKILKISEDMVFVGEKRFKKEEILVFVREVGDSNPIHQTDLPMVPGLLMFEWLLQKDGYPIHIMNFKLPVYAGEKIMVYKKTTTQQYFAVTEKNVLLWEAR